LNNHVPCDFDATLDCRRVGLSSRRDLHTGVMAVIFSDAQIRTRLSAEDAVRWMGEAIDEHHRGNLVAPARSQVTVGDGQIVFTAGRLRGSWFGYRSYDTFSAGHGEQMVVVNDEASGNVRAVAIGKELGPRRTGAIGAVAAEALASPGANVVAVIGAGIQAATQLWALAGVGLLGDVRVFSRDEERRDAFVRLATLMTGASCRSVSSAQSAVEGADIVILATTSITPVIETDWLAPTAYVSSLGPKLRGRTEFDLDLVHRASMIVTDSIAQVDSSDPPSVLNETNERSRLVTLGAVRAGDVTSRADQGITLFLSVGLAGTEVFLLDRLATSKPH
jgi:ornithine cyclodeaminase/alanine dehydrogenase-like protein (mu-crystallin family)